MTHRLNARLDDDLAAKLDAIRRMTKQSTTEVVRAALEHYHNLVRAQPAQAYRVMEESGFLGCGEADPDLSTNYKAVLSDSLARKA